MTRRTLFHWRKQQGWRRPPEAPTFLPGPRADGRSRPTRYRTVNGQPYAADAVGQAHILLTRTLMSQEAIAAQIGVGRSWVSRLLRRRGWARPPVSTGSLRFASMRRTAPLATTGDRRGHPYAPEIVAAARDHFTESELPTESIGRLVGVHPVTVARWARVKGWPRPGDRIDAQGRLRRRRRRF